MRKRIYQNLSDSKINTKCPPSMMLGGKGTKIEGKCLLKKFSCPKGTKYCINTDQCILDT